MRGLAALIVTGAAKVAAVVLPGRSRQAGWNVNNQQAIAVIELLFDRHTMVQVLVQAGLGAARFGKCVGAHNLSRPFVGRPQQDDSATLIGQGHAVIHQFFEVEMVAGRLEFEPFAFGLGQPAGYLIVGGHA
jgi:hypothetical protein